MLLLDSLLTIHLAVLSLLTDNYLHKRQLEITSLTTLVHTSTNHTPQTLFLEHWSNLPILVRFRLIKSQHSDLSKSTLLLTRQQELLSKEHLLETSQFNRIPQHRLFLMMITIVCSWHLMLIQT